MRSRPWVVGRDAPGRLPALVVVPSIFGPTPDLIALLTPLSERALVALPDPFWRKDGCGALPYVERARAVGRMQGFDPRRCTDDLAAVIDWARAHSNGRVVLLGICFGGPFVLRFAAQGRLAAGVTWHGTRMENFLDRADEIRCPLRLHFGAADPPHAGRSDREDARGLRGAPGGVDRRPPRRRPRLQPRRSGPRRPRLSGWTRGDPRAPRVSDMKSGCRGLRCGRLPRVRLRSVPAAKLRRVVVVREDHAD